MKKFYKSLLTLAFAIVFTASSFGANVNVKTMPLGDGISTSGVVLLVVKLTDDAIGPDMGFTLHEAEASAPWNDGMAIGMFDFKNAAPGIQLAGWNGGAWDYETNVKAVEKNKMIALWISIDAENNLHGLSAQMEGETEVTTIYTGYVDRESTRGGDIATVAKFCSVFVNDKDGQATTAIEVLKDAEIVSTIEAFDFSTLVTGVATAKTAAISVYPTLAKDFINISSTENLSSVKIFSLLGQEVFSGSDSKVIPVSALNSGTYIVEVKTVNNLVSRQKFIKK